MPTSSTGYPPGGHKTRTATPVALSHDEIRSAILKFFYDRNSSGTSRRGKHGTSVRISDVKSELKALHSLRQQDVLANLNYLLDKGWIREDVRPRTFTTPGGSVVSSEETWYSISAAGIDKFEGDSEFKTISDYAGVNISAISSVVTVGNGNVVHQKFAAVERSLQQLRDEVSRASDLDDSEKLEVLADIRSLDAQLAKSVPDRPIVERLWSAIERTVVATQAGQTALLVGKAIQAVLS